LIGLARSSILFLTECKYRRDTLENWRRLRAEPKWVDSTLICDKNYVFDHKLCNYLARFKRAGVLPVNMSGFN
jgi:hypothetical protein